MAVACAARQTPAPIEYLPRKAGLSQDKTTLSSGLCDLTSQPTFRISDPAPLTSGMEQQRNRGVRCVWFGNSSFIDSKIPGPTRSEKRADGPSGHCARNISDVPTKHTKKSAASGRMCLESQTNRR